MSRSNQSGRLPLYFIIKFQIPNNGSPELWYEMNCGTTRHRGHDAFPVITNRWQEEEEEDEDARARKGTSSNLAYGEKEQEIISLWRNYMARWSEGSRPKGNRGEGRRWRKGDARRAARCSSLIPPPPPPPASASTLVITPRSSRI